MTGVKGTKGTDTKSPYIRDTYAWSACVNSFCTWIAYTRDIWIEGAEIEDNFIGNTCIGNIDDVDAIKCLGTIYLQSSQILDWDNIALY